MCIDFFIFSLIKKVKARFIKNRDFTIINTPFIIIHCLCVSMKGVFNYETFNTR